LNSDIVRGVVRTTLFSCTLISLNIKGGWVFSSGAILCGESMIFPARMPSALFLALMFGFVLQVCSFGLVIFFQGVSPVCCQFHLSWNYQALPGRFGNALSVALDVDAVDVKSVGHCAVLRVLDLQHLF
jgi:hypothetical protein